MERKFTDDEIVKALECCIRGIMCRGGCPYDDKWDTWEECTSKLANDALDLINRQKAEIESLKEAYAIYEETTGLKWARAEAVKEFAKRLKAKLHLDGVVMGCNCAFVEDVQIDNLVKEMTGEHNG